jgi:Flp pilus assembly pilin Flp
MKCIFKIKTYLKENSGASLMEFAVVTALMAVLAATAAPKFSTISESGKFRKSHSEIQKIAKQALNFYQDMAVKEGRGRFPGQTKYNQKVGGHQSLSDLNDDLIGSNDDYQIFNPPSFKRFDSSDGSDWVSIFGIETYNGPNSQDLSLNQNYNEVGNLWQSMFGDEVLNSPYQDGHYIYQVLPGYGVGSQSEAPTLFIADLENPSQLHIIVKP